MLKKEVFVQKALGLLVSEKKKTGGGIGSSKADFVGYEGMRSAKG